MVFRACKARTAIASTAAQARSRCCSSTTACCAASRGTDQRTPAQSQSLAQSLAFDLRSALRRLFLEVRLPGVDLHRVHAALSRERLHVVEPGQQGGLFEQHAELARDVVDR